MFSVTDLYDHYKISLFLSKTHTQVVGIVYQNSPYLHKNEGSEVSLFTNNLDSFPHFSISESVHRFSCQYVWVLFAIFCLFFWCIWSWSCLVRYGPSIPGTGHSYYIYKKVNYLKKIF